MNAICFSLYGTDGKYTGCLLENLRRLPLLYPGWKPLVFPDGAIGEDWLQQCIELGAEVNLREGRMDAGGKFWRFESVGDPEWEAVIVRNADALVNDREAAAVSEWVASPAMLHAMHDAPYHWGAQWPVPGGMWGAKRGAFPNDFPHLVKWWIKHKGPFDHDSDQWFLRRYVWPYVLRIGMLHTSNVNSRYRGRPFPPHRPVQLHVGESHSAPRLAGQSQPRNEEPKKTPPLPHGFAA